MQEMSEQDVAVIGRAQGEPALPAAVSPFTQPSFGGPHGEADLVFLISDSL